MDAAKKREAGKTVKEITAEGKGKTREALLLLDLGDEIRARFNEVLRKSGKRPLEIVASKESVSQRVTLQDLMKIRINTSDSIMLDPKTEENTHFTKIVKFSPEGVSILLQDEEHRGTLIWKMSRLSSKELSVIANAGDTHVKDAIKIIDSLDKSTVELRQMVQKKKLTQEMADEIEQIKIDNNVQEDDFSF